MVSSLTHVLFIGMGLFWLGYTHALAQATSAPQGQRLPLDVPREPRPTPSDPPLLIERERTAQQVPVGAQELRLHLLGIDLVGNGAIGTARLEPLWSDLVGREISLDMVFEIAARITAEYRRAGFVLSQALVPQQQITQSGARVRIRVAEGYVSRLTVAPGVPGRERILETLAPVSSERPLTLATLERRLLLLNDLPGVLAQATLRPASEENSAELELLIERRRSAYSLSVTNRTTTAVGPLRLEASGERIGLFGDFDRHVLRWVGSGSDRLNLLAYSGDAPIGTHGLLASWAASASRSKPRQGELFQFNTDANNLSLTVSYPWVRSRSVNVALRGQFSAYNGSTDIADGLGVSKERIRALRAGLSVDIADGWGGVNLLDVEVSRGLSGLGASRADDPELLRQGSEPQFTKATLYAARLQSLGGEWSLLAAVTAQVTDDLLTSSEQLGLGGDTFLRAYDSSELLGDRGIAGKLEVRFNALLGPVASTWYAYHESGSVRLLAVDGGASGKASAISSGLGVRVSGPRGVKGYLEVAKPRHRATSKYGDERARWFAGLGVDF